MGSDVRLATGRLKPASCDRGIRYAGGRYAGFDFTIVADVTIQTSTFVISDEICTSAAVQAWVRIAFVYFCVTDFTFITGITLTSTYACHASSVNAARRGCNTGIRKPRLLPYGKHTGKS
jgi:hypothetical protein